MSFLRSFPRLFLPAIVCALLEACADDAADPERSKDAGQRSETAGALYAMMVQVYDTEDRTVYVRLSDSLDLSDGIDLTQAREFGGVANLAAVGGKLLVSSGLEPVITKYDISKELQWTEEDTVSFADYPFSDNANFYYQYILNDATAYMPFDVTKRLIWNPTEMTIEDTLEDSALPLKQGKLMAEVGGNRNSIRFKAAVQQAFFYTDADYFEYAQASVIGIYDPETHQEQKLLTIPCPGLSMASQDEDGYTYYATWDFQKRALFGEGPKPCIARLKPDLTVDSDWTTDLRDWTDGRYHNNFRYIGNGRAIANVFHQELFDAAWKAGYDPDVGEKLGESGEHWKLWLFDLKARTAKPVEGIDVALSSGAQFAVLDGRTFVFLPYDDWSRTKVYELDEAAARASAPTPSVTSSSGSACAERQRISCEKRMLLASMPAVTISRPPLRIIQSSR